MKTDRHAKIIELIQSEEIETQEELVKQLTEAGFQVTQATVSRDVRELGLTKAPVKGGRQRYVFRRTSQKELLQRHRDVFCNGYLSMDIAQNILIIRTVEGMAMAVAAAIDALNWQEVVGCIAGDDTIFCAMRNQEDTRKIMKKMEALVKELC